MEISSDFLESSNLTGVQPVDEATLIEERRKRREAIKAKHGCQKSPMLVQSPALNSQPTKVTSNSSASGHHSQAARTFHPRLQIIFTNGLSQCLRRNHPYCRGTIIRARIRLTLL